MAAATNGLPENPALLRARLAEVLRALNAEIETIEATLLKGSDEDVVARAAIAARLSTFDAAAAAATDHDAVDDAFEAAHAG